MLSDYEYALAVAVACLDFVVVGGGVSGRKHCRPAGHALVVDCWAILGRVCCAYIRPVFCKQEFRVI